jgi:riboflavin kinase/FMN adenylyltransferase
MKDERGLEMSSFAFNSQFSILNFQLGSVATIGSFDGVHRGHQCLLSQVRHIADERGLRAMAITFGTSPRSVLGKGDCSRLTTADERTTLLRQVGMDEVAVLDFTPEMAAMTARDFMQQVLRDQLHVAVLVIGYDHRFGRGRSEGFDDYVRYGQEMGIEVVRGEACIEDGEPVSSTRIRHLLEEGQVDEAAQLLGYRYTLRGRVVGGYREGRKMGFPTANIRIDNGQQTTDKVCASERNASALAFSQRVQPNLNNEVVSGQQTTDEVTDCKLIPADGVYAVWVKIGQQTTDNGQRTTDKTCVHELQDKNNIQFSIFNSQLKKGMLNIGHRPTLNNGRERSIEVHILDFDGDLYGKDITIEFVYRLREERAFANTEELTEQLRKDRERVRELLVES